MIIIWSIPADRNNLARWNVLLSTMILLMRIRNNHLLIEESVRVIFIKYYILLSYATYSNAYPFNQVKILLIKHYTYRLAHTAESTIQSNAQRAYSFLKTSERPIQSIDLTNGNSRTNASLVLPCHPLYPGILSHGSLIGSNEACRGRHENMI